MSRPVTEITMPSDLAGARNGAVPRELLREIAPGILLHSRAADAWDAMVAACFAATGVRLSAANAFRSFSVQTVYWLERYTREIAGTDGSKVCNGETWFHIRGTTVAACPGTSNHGWGLAVDLTSDSVAWGEPWLLEHAHEFGWSWEAGIDISEPWHLHYFAGDQMFHVEHPEESDMGLTPIFRRPTVRPQNPARPGPQVLDFSYLEVDTAGNAVFGYVIDAKVIVRRPGGGEATIYFDGVPQALHLSPDGRPTMIPVARPGLCSIVGDGIEAEAREIWRAG